MPYELKGRNVLVTGGSRGLGAEICRAFAARGCNIAINYFANEAPAQSLAKELESAHPEIKTTTIQGDGGVTADMKSCVQTARSALGGLDVVVGNHGWTRFSAFSDLEALSDEEWDKCWHTNVLGMKALASAAMPVFNANPEGGVILITSSVAGRSLGGSSMAYSVTKAAQLHLVKCLAQTQGRKVRVNAVLPGLLLTDWGREYGEEKIRGLKEKAVLGKETELRDCAEAFVGLAGNGSVTGQFLQVGEFLSLRVVCGGGGGGGGGVDVG